MHKLGVLLSRRVRRSQRLTTSNTTIVINRGIGEDGSAVPDTQGLRAGRRNVISSSQFPTHYGSFAAPAGAASTFAAFTGNPSGVVGGFGSSKNTMSNFSRAVPYKHYKPSVEEEKEIIKKLEETVGLSQLPAAKSPPKKHRGFGARAQRFNEDGSLDVGEFRSKWRCTWCLLSGKFTPTLRRGPMGSKVNLICKNGVSLLLDSL